MDSFIYPWRNTFEIRQIVVEFDIHYSRSLPPCGLFVFLCSSMYSIYRYHLALYIRVNPDIEKRVMALRHTTQNRVAAQNAATLFWVVETIHGLFLQKNLDDHDYLLVNVKVKVSEYSPAGLLCTSDCVIEIFTSRSHPVSSAQSVINAPLSSTTVLVVICPLSELL